MTATELPTVEEEDIPDNACEPVDEPVVNPKPKRKPGRPPGFLNKKTLAKQSALAADPPGKASARHWRAVEGRSPQEETQTIE